MPREWRLTVSIVNLTCSSHTNLNIQDLWHRNYNGWNKTVACSRNTI